jgi:hypothetical protein
LLLATTTTREESEMNQSSANKQRRSARRSLVAIAVGFAVLMVAGGVAYASSTDADGTIHGCHETNTGDLRVIPTSKGGNCNPTETPLSRSQTGPAAAKAKGAPGATSGTATVPDDGLDHTLVTLDNGVALHGVCGPDSRSVEILLRDSTGGRGLKLWGTFTTDFVLTPTSGDNLSTAGPLPGGSEVDLSVVARNKAVGPFAHIDLYGASGPSCEFSWMAIPSTG